MSKHTTPSSPRTPRTPHHANEKTIAIVPSELRQQNGNQLRVWIELQLRGADMRPVRASARSIADAIHTTHTSVLRALRRLESAGWVTRAGTPRMPTYETRYSPTIQG